VVALAAVVLGAAYVGGGFDEQAPSAPTGPTLAPASIAVLPIADASPGNAGRDLAEALTEALTNALGRVPGLRVASRTAAAGAQRQAAGVQDIGRALGVGKLVEGTVQRRADKFRATVRLLDVRDGFTEWSQTYDRRAGDGFAVEDSIAADVAAAVAWRMALPAPPGAPRPDTTSARPAPPARAP
jgi:serine/threonine-protein kinase